MRACLDTSYLISFADPTRKNHKVAVEYYKYFVANGYEMPFSTLAASEFEVKQPVTDLPLNKLKILPFNIDHARKAGEFRRKVMSGEIKKDREDSRSVVAEDLKILAQAESEGIEMIFTEDKSTLAKYAQRLIEAGISHVRPALLAEGFSPGSLSEPDQQELDLPSS